MPKAELQSSLAQFAAFARALKGDEKSEAQSFLDHFDPLASKEKAGEKITPPGLPLVGIECGAFITDDSVRVGKPA